RFVAQVRELEVGEADLVIKEHSRSRIIIKQTQETETPEVIPIAASTSVDLVQHQSAAPVAVLAPPLRRTIWQRKKMIMVGLTGLLVLLVAVFGVFRWQRSKRQFGQSKPLQITRLTTTGNVLGAMLSPDGKYMASVRRERAGLSLWVRHMATGSDIQLRPPAMVRIYGHIFSPDSNYIYFIMNEAEDKPNILFRLPVLGGTARKVIEDVNGPISFSPDGARFAFIRTIEGQFSLMLANSDGSEVQMLARSQLFDAFRYPQWSPDGTMITYTAYDYDAA